MIIEEINEIYKFCKELIKKLEILKQQIEENKIPEIPTDDLWKCDYCEYQSRCHII